MNGRVRAASAWKGLLAFDAKSGEVKWRYSEGYSPTAPFIADEVLFTEDHDFPSHIYAIK